MCRYQKLSIYLKQYGSYVLHKISASGAISTLWRKSTLELDVSTGPYLCCYQILSKYCKPHTQEFGIEIHSGMVTRNQPQQRLSFLHATCLLVLTYASTKYYQSTFVFQTIKKSLSAQEFGLEIYSGECTRKRTKQELS